VESPNINYAFIALSESALNTAYFFLLQKVENSLFPAQQKT
jgi:hypothetical protein